MSSLTALYKDLLFLDGHIADPQLAASLSAPAPATTALPRSSAMNLFKSLMYLGGLESLDPRIEDEEAFGPTYGNKIASRHLFGAPVEANRTRPPRVEAARKPRRGTAPSAGLVARCH